MPRPVSDDTIQVGPVRIRHAGDRFRLRWVEGGTDRERKVGSLAEAQQVALDVAMHLNDPTATSPQPSSSHAAIRSTNPEPHSDWTTTRGPLCSSATPHSWFWSSSRSVGMSA